MNYREVAEHLQAIAMDDREEGFSEFADSAEFAREIMLKLASGYVLVPGNAVGWVCADGTPALIGSKPLPPGTSLYAAAPEQP